MKDKIIYRYYIMPYKKRYKKRTKRPLTVASVKNIARKAVTQMAETKQLYTEVDELTVTSSVS